MSKDNKENVEKCNKYFGPNLFNATWDLIDKGDKRTEEDELMMIHTAHASAYHWRQVGKPINFARSEWQLSRVYSILKRAQQAMYHAQNCLNICKECKKNNDEIADWDIPFAFEALARASLVSGANETAEKFLKLAKTEGEKISGDGDKKYFFSEIETIKID